MADTEEGQGAVGAVVDRIDKNAPTWVREVQRAAKYAGTVADALAQILEAVEAVIGGLAAGFRAVSTKLARPRA